MKESTRYANFATSAECFGTLSTPQAGVETDQSLGALTLRDWSFFIDPWKSGKFTIVNYLTTT
jgi:hypothetical protein